MDQAPLDNALARRHRELLPPVAALRDPQARLAWLVERARRRPMLPESLRIEAHRVEGCVVRLWWVPEFRDGRCWFRMDSDAASLKAVIGLLCDFYSGAAPEEIVACPPDFLERLGLLRQLAENRRATVGRIAGAIQQFAREQLRPLPSPPGSQVSQSIPRPA
jgi:cysteine desulfuration protein SufE